MQSSLKEIIISGQNKGEIVINMTANEISEYLFIVARGIAYDWCLHDGEYNMEQYIHDYFNRYIVIFKNL
jgi:hypothetical protein